MAGPHPDVGRVEDMIGVMLLGKQTRKNQCDSAHFVHRASEVTQQKPDRPRSRAGDGAGVGGTRVLCGGRARGGTRAAGSWPLSTPLPPAT